jgi:hypothetical protein
MGGWMGRYESLTVEDWCFPLHDECVERGFETLEGAEWQEKSVCCF